MEIVEQFLRATVKLFPIDDAQTARLAAEKNVLGDAEIFNQRQFLIDNRDTGLLRVADTRKAARGALKHNLAAVFRVRIDAGEKLGQCRFSGAVLSRQNVNFACSK